ncbi:MAG: large-conductance mechanosensitive channel protein MscL [Oscillospiraceae bacterium]|jgi:large conductance mechanosensitive channel|nr:large-conductance mechanosensitive channel protein MscL [Oscillospiraceae bacterium]MDD3260891.1 large-conductance mechanosensitive channel protein MscL [Oscillospiraceae bacterium]
MKKFFQEFKEFAMRGSVIDMAVGVVIGTAFSAIVNSLVKDIIMPLLGLLTGKVNFSSLSLSLGGSAVLTYGAFLQAVFNFLLISLSIFFIVKVINRLSRLRHPAEEEKKEVAPTKEELLLAEIRDLLKEQDQK